MTTSTFKVTILLSFLALACGRPSDRVTYNDLESLGASCPKRDKCAGYQGNLTYVDRSCECDRLCIYYDDCCADAPARMNASRRLARNNMICLDYGEKFHTGVYVVSTCSRNWYGSSEVRRKCSGPPDWSDPLTATPVTDVAQAVTYRNLFCAECNNANMRSLKNFQIRMGCEGLPEQLSEEQIFADITYNEQFHSWGLYRFNSFENRSVYYGCDMIFDVPGYLNHSVRFCRSNIISTCAPNYNRQQIRNQCGEYMAVVYDTQDGYKNPHCAMCNHKAVNQVSCTADLMGRRRPMSFALLLDVNQSDGDQVGMKRLTTPQCPHNHKYDPYFKKCRQLVCALPGYVVVDGRCVRR